MTDLPYSYAADYDQLRKLVAARRVELGLRQLEVDDLAGVPNGYTGKLECGMKHFGDISLGPVLGVLGIVLSASKQSETDSETWTKGRLAEKAKRKIQNGRGLRPNRVGAIGVSPRKRRPIGSGATSAGRRRKAAANKWLAPATRGASKARAKHRSSRAYGSTRPCDAGRS